MRRDLFLAKFYTNTIENLFAHKILSFNQQTEIFSLHYIIVLFITYHMKIVILKAYKN